MHIFSGFLSSSLIQDYYNYREIPPGPPQPSSTMRGLPGPQVPPRNPPGGGENSSVGGSSDRLLSVSGKKKCSHCGEELGKSIASKSTQKVAKIQKWP